MAEKKKPAGRKKPTGTPAGKTPKKKVKRPAKNRAPAAPNSRKSITRKQAERQLREDAERITPEDVQTVIDKSGELEDRFESEGPLAKFLGDFKLLIAIVRDYWKGRYRKIPYWSVAAIVAALLYVLNPFDLIPDVIPLIGQLDDALVVAACLAMIRQDLHDYRKWKRAGGRKPVAGKRGKG